MSKQFSFIRNAARIYSFFSQDKSGQLRGNLHSPSYLHKMETGEDTRQRASQTPRPRLLHPSQCQQPPSPINQEAASIHHPSIIHPSIIHPSLFPVHTHPDVTFPIPFSSPTYALLLLWVCSLLGALGFPFRASRCKFESSPRSPCSRCNPW